MPIPRWIQVQRYSITGPIRVEVTLTNKQDIDNFKEYLDRLSGTLPAKAPNVGRGRPAGSTTKELESPREDILADVEKMIEEGKKPTRYH